MFVVHHVIWDGSMLTCINASVGQGSRVVVSHLHQVGRQGPHALWQRLAQLMQRHLHRITQLVRQPCR